MAFAATCVSSALSGDGQQTMTPGVVPFEVALRGPDGKRHPPSGVHTMIDGAMSVQWTPARNDPPGTWTVTVRELLSGLRAERTIELAP